MSEALDILMIEGSQQLRQTDDWTPALVYSLRGGVKTPLFQSLLLAPPMINQRFMYGLAAGYIPARLKEWKEWGDLLFARGNWLSSIHKTAIQYDLPIIEIWVTLPYPRFGQEDFGTLHQLPLLFYNLEDRSRALQWWIQYVTDGFKKYVHGLWKRNGAIPKLRLRGFAWGRESIPHSDESLVQSINQYLNSIKLESLWLTNYGTAELANWKTLGFNHASIFSNYTGKTEYGLAYLFSATNYALAYHMGLQIICGKGSRFDNNHFLHYLKQKEIYQQRGGKGPIIYRFPNQSIHTVYHHHPFRYAQIYQSISQRLDNREGDKA